MPHKILVAQGGGPRLETDDETRSINPAAVAEAVRSAAVAPQRAAEPAAAPPRPHLVEPPAADPAKHADASPKRPLLGSHAPRPPARLPSLGGSTK